MSSASKDPIERHRSDGDSPSSSSATSSSSSSDSSSSSISSSSSESATSTVETREMTKEKLVRRIMKQLSISNDSLGEGYESESSKDDDNKSKTSKVSKASSRKNGKMIDSILDEISLGDSASKKKMETEETEAEETEMDETEMEQTEVEETEVDETEDVEEISEEEQSKAEEDAAEAVAQLLQLEGAMEDDDIDAVLRNVLSDDTDPRVIRPPLVHRRTKVIDEELATARSTRSASRDEAPAPEPAPSSFSFFPSFDQMFGCSANKQLTTSVDTPVAKASKERSVPALLKEKTPSNSPSKASSTSTSRDSSSNSPSKPPSKAPSKVSSNESEMPPKTSSRTRSTDGSEKDRHAPMVVEDVLKPHSIVEGKEDRPSTSGSAPRPLLVDPSTFVTERDAALTGMGLNPIIPPVLPAASSGANSSAKSKSKAPKLVMTHSMPLEMKMSTDSGYSGKDMLRTIRSDDMEAVTAAKTGAAISSRAYKKGWSFSSTTKTKAGDPATISTSNGEPTKDGIANEGVVSIVTPDLNVKDSPNRQSSPTTENGELRSEFDTAEGGKADNLVMGNTTEHESETIDDADVDRYIDGLTKAETQPTIRLSKKLKHWAVKKRGKQDATRGKDGEPASLEPAASASMIVNRQPSRRLKRKGRKKRKTNVFRSIANYVKNQAPALPVISEDPDHPDHQDDDSFAASSTKEQAQEEVTSEQVVDCRSSHTDNDEVKNISDTPSKPEMENEEGEKIKSSSQDPISTNNSRQEVGKSTSSGTTEDSNPSFEDTSLLRLQEGHMPSPQDKRTCDSDQKPSVVATISSDEVLSAKSTETTNGAEAINAMSGSNDDGDMESEMGLEMALSMPGDAEETGAGSRILSVDIAALNNKASSNFKSPSIDEEQDEESRSSHHKEKNHHSFKNFFRMSKSKSRSKKQIDQAERFSADIAEVENGFQASLNTPALSPQNTSRFTSRKTGKQSSATSPEKAVGSPDRTGLKSMSSLSASSPAGLKSLSSEDGVEDQKRRVSKTKRTSKVANKARKVWNMGKSRKNLDERSPVYEESREALENDIANIRSLKNIRMPPPEADEAEDIVEADLSGPIPLRRWESVEQKIDESLKKVEALAANYGEDFNALLLHKSASDGEVSSAGDSSSVDSSLIRQSESIEWRKSVEKKIDDNLSIVQRLANRLGIEASE